MYQNQDLTYKIILVSLYRSLTKRMSLEALHPQYKGFL